MAKKREGRQTKIDDVSGARESGASRIIEIEEGQKRRSEKRAQLVKSEKAQRRREKSRVRQARPKLTPIKKFAVFGVLIIAGLLFIHSGNQIAGLNLDKARYEKEYEEKLDEKARLEKTLSSIDDPAYIEQQARDRFHMLREGEILYVFSEAESAEAQ